MSMRFFFLISFGLLLASGGQTALAQGKRVALVIGNSDYAHATKLENPKNDAADIGAALQALGFQVVQGVDLDKAAMDRTIRDFAMALAGAKVGLFFYAGHGLQVSGQNYLVPVDAKLSTASGLDFETVRLDLVHRTMERETSTNIIFLDACRDNPLSRNLARAMGTRSVSVGKGLAVVESGEGTLISFSTQPGNVALDGTGGGRNSPYATALVKHISAPGEDLPSILINVRNDVMQSTERRQVPWEHSAMTARFFFSEPKATQDQQAELNLWEQVKDSADPQALAGYLRNYPQGNFAVVARTLVVALEKQREMQSAAQQQESANRQNDLRKAQEDVRKAQEAAQKSMQTAAVSPKMLGPTAEYPFDGTWNVEFRGGQFCSVKANSTTWVISKGAFPDFGRGTGSVTKSGQLEHKWPGVSNSNVTVSSSATLKEGSGSGTYFGGHCTGTLTLVRSEVRTNSTQADVPIGANGNWRLVRTSPGCRKQTEDFVFPVRNGQLLVKIGAGTIGSTGSFSYTGTNPEGGEFSYIGKIEGDTGRGEFKFRMPRGGVQCGGTFTLAKVPG